MRWCSSEITSPRSFAKLGSVCTFQAGVSRKRTPDPRLGIFRLAGTIHCLPAADGSQAGKNSIDQMWLRQLVKIWPRVSTILKAWFVLTLIGIGVLVWVIPQWLHDEEVIFQDFTGQLVLATLNVGIPSFAGLLLFLFLASWFSRKTIPFWLN